MRIFSPSSSGIKMHFLFSRKKGKKEQGKKERKEKKTMEEVLEAFCS